MQNKCNKYQYLDREAAKTWIYPINYPLRKYQYDIVKTALYQNTLICLPTGLGKTFIAAVVMYNFYRWYPTSKIVFMAPTKPLVAQQIESCYNIMGIPQEHSIEMTGIMSPEKSNEEWSKFGMFFLTPQVLMNDLARGNVPLQAIKLVVVDEAHNAQGDHPYCQVVKLLQQENYSFQLLALSATPGSDLAAVQLVLRNLLISAIEVRCEDSPDVTEYIQCRTVETIVVQFDGELKRLSENYMQVLRKYVLRLLDRNLLFTKDENTLTKFQILKAREAFRQNPPIGLTKQDVDVMEGTFSTCMTLYHGLELVKQHGARSFYKFLAGTIENKMGPSNSCSSELSKDQNFLKFFGSLHEKFGDNEYTIQNMVFKHSETKQYDISHPKLKRLLHVVIDHFSKTANAKSTRIIIFSQYRESVLEITEMLRKQHPLIKPMNFVGQSSENRSGSGFSQKQQIKVLNDFKNGDYNTLISTCVGEEGLDIGEVDLIICYDCQKSPIRMIQRMGRTGRKREGKVVVLVTEGKEHQDYKHCMLQSKVLNSHLSSEKLQRHLYQNPSKLFPEDIKPICVKLHMKVKEWKSKESIEKGTKNMHSFFKKSEANQSPSRKTMQILTEDQMHWYNSNLKIGDEEILSFRKSTLVSKSKGESSNTITTVDFGDFQPWQTTLQGCVSISHSKKAQSLVDLTQFIGRQSITDGNEYEEDLRQYFNADFFKETKEIPGNESLQRGKRKKTDNNGKRKKIKRGNNFSKPSRDISHIFAGVKRKNDLNVMPLSASDDIILIENSTVLPVDDDLSVSSTYEISNFWNLNLDKEKFFDTSAVIRECIMFDVPPCYSSNIIPCSPIETKKILHDLTLKCKRILKNQLNCIFSADVKSKSVAIMDDSMFSCSNPVAKINSQENISCDNKFSLTGFDVARSPILSSSRSRKVTNMTSTPIKFKISSPKILVTPIKSKRDTGVPTIYEEKDNYTREWASFDQLDDPKSKTITDLVDFDLLDQPFDKVSTDSNIPITVNRNNISVNFDLVDEDLFLDYDLDSAEKEFSYKQNIRLPSKSDDVSILKSQPNVLVNINDSHSVQIISTSKKIIAYKSDFAESFPTPNVIKKTSKVKQEDFSRFVINKRNDGNLMSISQVMDMVNEPKCTSKLTPTVEYTPKLNSLIPFNNIDAVPSTSKQSVKRNIDKLVLPCCPEFIDISREDLFITKNVSDGFPNDGWVSCKKSLKKSSIIANLKEDCNKKSSCSVGCPNKKSIFKKKQIANDIFEDNSDDEFEKLVGNLSILENEIVEMSTCNQTQLTTADVLKVKENQISNKIATSSLGKTEYSQNQNINRANREKIVNTFLAKSPIFNGMSPKKDPICKSDVKYRNIITISADSGEKNSLNKQRLKQAANSLCEDNNKLGKVIEQSVINGDNKDIEYSTSLKRISNQLSSQNNSHVLFSIGSQKENCRLNKTAVNNLLKLNTCIAIDSDSNFDFEPHLLDAPEKDSFIESKLLIQSSVISNDRDQNRDEIVDHNTADPNLSTKKNTSNLFSGNEITRSLESYEDNDLTSKSLNISKNESVVYKKRGNFFNIIDSDSDDDFELQPKILFKRDLQKEDQDNYTISNKMKRSDKKCVQFVDLEAEVCDDWNSADESESDLDCYDNSFIDDQLPCTIQNKTDMEAIYLRSVRSPSKNAIVVGKANRNLKHILSQEDDRFDGDTDEEEDSFVVDNDFIEYDTQFMGTSMLAEDPIINQAIEKKHKKRKRIIKCISSEEESSPNKKLSDNIFSGAVKKSSTYDSFVSSSARTQVNHCRTDAVLDIPTKNVFPTNHLDSKANFSGEKFFQPLKKTHNFKQHNKKIAFDGKEFSLLPSTTDQTAEPNTLDQTSCSNVDFMSNQSKMASSIICKDSFVDGITPAPSTKSIAFSGGKSIMIDCVEINIAGLIASHLRLKSGVQTFITTISPASYVLSSRVGVYRLHYSVFSKSSYRDRIVERVKNLLMLYERPTVIVEKDNTLNNLSMQRSSYLDSISCALAQLPQLKFLYSNSQEETCAILEHLLKIEKIKGYSLPNINFHDENVFKVFKFYSSIPKLSPSAALILISKYPKICYLIWSIPSLIEKCGISKEQRNSVIAHLQRHFNKDLLPPSFKL